MITRNSRNRYTASQQNLKRTPPAGKKKLLVLSNVDLLRRAEKTGLKSENGITRLSYSRFACCLRSCRANCEAHAPTYPKKSCIFVKNPTKSQKKIQKSKKSKKSRAPCSYLPLGRAYHKAKVPSSELEAGSLPHCLGGQVGLVHHGWVAQLARVD